MVMATSLVMLMVALADLEPSAWLVAVTVTAAGLGSTAGAVYTPETIVPRLALPPAIPFTLHVTALLLLPVTVAVNGCELPSRTLEAPGVTLTVTGGAGVGTGEVCWLPPQP